MSGEVSKNFDDITRNFEENFEKRKVNFNFHATDRELMKPRLH